MHVQSKHMDGILYLFKPLVFLWLIEFVVVFCFPVTTFKGIRKANIQGAREYCIQKNASLPIGMTDVERVNILVSIRKHLLNQSWIGVRRVTGRWRWSNGSALGYKPRRGSWKHTCGSLRDTGIYASDCFAKLDGYACRYHGKCTCPGGPCKRLTLPGKKACLAFSSTKTTYFKAAALCEKTAGTLASIDSEELKHTDIFTEKEYWIGLYSSVWTTLSSPSERVPVAAMAWKHNSNMKYKENNCVVADISSGDIEWISVNCTMRFTFICIFHFSEMKNATTASDLENISVALYRKQMLLFICGAGFSVFLLVTVICAAVCYFVRKHRSGQDNAYYSSVYEPSRLVRDQNGTLCHPGVLVGHQPSFDPIGQCKSSSKTAHDVITRTVSSSVLYGRRHPCDVTLSVRRDFSHQDMRHSGDYQTVFTGKKACMLQPEVKYIHSSSSSCSGYTTERNSLSSGEYSSDSSE